MGIEDAVLEDTIAVGAKTLWLQSGLWHEQVARDGEAAGLQVVLDRCLKVEHTRLLGSNSSKLLTDREIAQNRDLPAVSGSDPG